MSDSWRRRERTTKSWWWRCSLRADSTLISRMDLGILVRWSAVCISTGTNRIFSPTSRVRASRFCPYARHWRRKKSVSNGSTDVLEHILSHEDCDVDPINRIEKATPLHLAVKLEHPELRKHVVDSLLEAGADTSCVILLSWLHRLSLTSLSIRDKFGETALDLVPSEDTEVRALFRKAQAQASISQDDIASGEHFASMDPWRWIWFGTRLCRWRRRWIRVRIRVRWWLDVS